MLFVFFRLFKLFLKLVISVDLVLHVCAVKLTYKMSLSPIYSRKLIFGNQIQSEFRHRFCHISCTLDTDNNIMLCFCGVFQKI